MYEDLQIRSKRQHNNTVCTNIHPRKRHVEWALDVIQNEFNRNNQLFLGPKVKLYNESKSIFESFKMIHGYFHPSKCNICIQMKKVSDKFEWLDRAIFVKKRNPDKKKEFKLKNSKKSTKKVSMRYEKKVQDETRLSGLKRGNMIPKGPIIKRIGRTY